MAESYPSLTLYFLQASRSIRIAWLLEELSLPYTSHFFPRINNKAPPEFKTQSGNPLGKAPVLKDGDITVTESGAITEFLCERYDNDGRLMGGMVSAMGNGDGEARREKVRMWIHAAEGTFMVHALATTYARWFSSENMKSSGELKELEKGLAVNVGRDLDWLNDELANRRFLVGNNVTAADTMVLFSIQFTFARDLCAGRKVGEWRNVERWIGECEGTESYKRAVKKTGHEM